MVELRMRSVVLVQLYLRKWLKKYDFNISASYDIG